MFHFHLILDFFPSEDDFYILATGLVVMETTNEVFNLSLYDVVVPQSLMSWVRVIVSNRIATNGSYWTETMSKYNSGTYNNQWMVIDFKLFQAGVSPLSPNLLWIGSQLPGYFESADVTDVINNQGYWPSYNVPFFPFIFEMAGYGTAVEQWGNLWSYEYCPRANIFRQRQNSVQSVEDLQVLVRYNNWQHDPLSLGCPLNQIASRLDLSPNTTGFCGAAAFGAINGKITSSSMVPTLSAKIVAGPTHDQQPVFSWTPEVEKAFPTTFHYGQPKTFDFEWFEFTPLQY